MQQVPTSIKQQQASKEWMEAPEKERKKERKKEGSSDSNKMHFYRKISCSSLKVLFESKKFADFEETSVLFNSSDAS